MQASKFEIIIFVIAITIIIGALCLASIKIVYCYSRKQINHANTISDLQSIHLKTILNTKLETQEKTFQHLSREIHDSINSALCLVKVRLNSLKWDKLDLSKKQVGTSISILSESIENLSAVSKGLSGTIIKNVGIWSAIETEIARIMNVTNLDISFEICGEAYFLDDNKELAIFRIIQEALNNIIKHSGATTASILFTFSRNEILFEISDNGVGFPSNEKMEEKKSSAGLENMRVRATCLAGNMSIETSNSGTRLTFKIPTYDRNSAEDQRGYC